MVISESGYETESRKAVVFRLNLCEKYGKTRITTPEAPIPSIAVETTMEAKWWSKEMTNCEVR